MNISKILEGNQNQRGIFLGYEHKNGKDIKKAITQNQTLATVQIGENY